jgi:hypothetical protein
MFIGRINSSYLFSSMISPRVAGKMLVFFAGPQGINKLLGVILKINFYRRACHQTKESVTSCDVE